jgi:demethylmenaquinone methyltransferase/2-methoxy-6-polyprenyl-1,4-benzoquinol methylase
VAFGVRNIARQEALFAEMLRVLRPGGRFAVLEIFSPRSGFVGAGYDLYLRHLIPVMGTLVGGDGPAYRHLAASVKAFGLPEEFAAKLSAAGFVRVTSRGMNFGTIGLVGGEKP